METFFLTIGLMTCVYGILEVLSILCKRLDEQFDPKKSSNWAYDILSKTAALVVYICMMCSAPIGILVSLHDRRMEKVHRELFLEDRKPYEDVLNSQIAALSAENERLQSKIDLTDKRHRNEVSDARSNGYKSGYVNGYAVGFEDCFSHFSIQGVPEQDLKRMARLSGIHRIKSRRSIFDKVEAVEHDGILT